MKSSLMTVCGLVIQSFFLHSPHLVLASVPIAPFKVAREATSGFSDEHTLLAIKSAVELPEQSPKSLLCRRDLSSCFGRLMEMWGTTSQQKLVRRHIPYALHEEAIIKLAQTQAVLHPWNENDKLVDTMLRIATARRHLTQYGSFNKNIYHYLMVTKLPGLFGKVFRDASAEIEYMDRQTTAENGIHEKIYILDTFVQAELGDKDFSNSLERLREPLRLLNARFPNAAQVFIRDETSIPTFQPSLSKEARDEWDRTSKTSFRWVEYQLRLERNYGIFLQTRQRPHTDDTAVRHILRVYDGLGNLFTREVDPKPLDPKKYTLENFQLMESAHSARKILIGEMRDFGLDMQHQVQANPKMIFLTLVIESSSGPHSQEALETLRRLFHALDDNLKATIGSYLNLAESFQDKSKFPPDDDILEYLRPEDVPVTARAGRRGGDPQRLLPVPEENPVNAGAGEVQHARPNLPHEGLDIDRSTVSNPQSDEISFAADDDLWGQSDA